MNTLNKRHLINGLLITLIAGTTGCVSTSLKTTFARRAHYQLQPIPANLFSSDQAYTHEVTLIRKDKEYSFLSQSELLDGNLTLVGLAPLGRLFTLSFSEELTGEVNSVLPGFVKPKHFLADFQLVYWQAEALETGGLIIKDTEDSRKVFKGKRHLATITYDGSPQALTTAATLQNHPRKYQVVILPAM